MFGCRHLAQVGTCLLKVQNNYFQIAMASLLVPTTSVRGQDKVNYDAFKITMTKVPCLVLPKKQVDINEYIKKLKEYFLKLPQFKPVQSDEHENSTIVHLNPDKIANITDKLKEEVNWNTFYNEIDVDVDYENWPRDEVLRAILPLHIDVPTSYSVVGHILHFNLREEQLPYKNVIGQVFLDKTPNAKTIVNKLDAIDNTYRNFEMEILAGDENTCTTVKESKCLFKFDFSKVYWNPRLGNEHASIIQLLKPNDALYDVFAGVGPFSVPAAKKKVYVLANDLNPDSYKWLIYNAQKNKVMKHFKAFNKDGRDFLKNDVKQDLIQRRSSKALGSEHIVMNLPGLAVEFLDIFISDWLNLDEKKQVCTNPPLVHVYCFIKAAKTEDFKSLAKQLVESKLGSILTEESISEIDHVRNVAPNKEMMRVSFYLTKDILLEGSLGEPARKKIKTHCSNVNDVNFIGENGQKKGQYEGEESVQSIAKTS